MQFSNFRTMSTNLVQIEGAIIFRVTDLQLAIEIDQLVKKHGNIPAPSIGKRKAKIHNGNGRAKSPDTKDRILAILKERYSASWFTIAGSEQLVKEAIGSGLSTLRRAVNYGIEKGILGTDGSGKYHFLESASIQRPAPGSGK
jgi:hypothetical protein